MTQRRTLFFFAIILAILGSTFLVIQLAKGYKPDLSKKTFLPTGLLVATSIPDGAQIWINNQLKSATNTTISLSPGRYDVEIKKESFIPWKKSLKIEKELVVKTDAYLFPQVSDLKALTFTGATNPLLSPDGTKVIYQVKEKNGLWLLDLTDLPFGISREPRQIIRSTPARDFAKSTYKWSPDSKQILVTFIKGKTEENFLLDPNSLNLPNTLVDITPRLTITLRQWEKDTAAREEQKFKKVPPEILAILQKSAKNIFFSLDETKILYAATASATMAENIIPPVPAASTQKEERNLKLGQTYIYDIKEDRNFFVTDQEAAIGSQAQTATLKQPALEWFPTSRHLILVEKEKITVMEYDGTNKMTVYSGPYEFPFAFPFPGGNKLLILAALGKDLPLNLYAVSLR